MSTNGRNRIPQEGRAPRRNSARLEADYRQEVRKAAEERVRRRQGIEARERAASNQPSPQANRYREDYRQRNRNYTYQHERMRGGDASSWRRPAERKPDRRTDSRGDVREPGGYTRRQDRPAPNRYDRRTSPAHDERRAANRRNTARSQRPQHSSRKPGTNRRPGGTSPTHGRGIASPRVVAAILIVIALLIIATAAVRIAVSLAPGEPATILPDIESQVATRASAYKLPETEIASRLEDLGVDETWAQQAATLAQSDHRFMVMAQRSDILGQEGSEITNKLVKLAVSDPEAVDFVYDYLDLYPQKTAQRYADAVTRGVIPRFYQWDERWGYITYSGSSFGCSGCGPTSLSMVYMGLTGDSSQSPADIAKLASDGGYETDNEGTLNQFFVDAAYKLGLDVVELDVDRDALMGALESGMPVICNVGPGDFTLSGHFFVITGANEDGTLNINDPFSSVNSSEPWDADLILNQTYALYAYSVSDDEDESNEAEDSSEAGDAPEEATDDETTESELP